MRLGCYLFLAGIRKRAAIQVSGRGGKNEDRADEGAVYIFGGQSLPA